MLTQDTAHLDYLALTKASRRLDRSRCTQTLRLALLSDAALQQLVPLLEVLFARQGVRAEIYRGDFDATEIEVCNPDSGLYTSAPDVVVLLPATSALRLRYYRSNGARDSFAADVADRFAFLWDTLRGRSHAAILQGNFVLPYERAFGNFDHHVPTTWYPTVVRLNAAVAELARARAGVLINDVEALASYIGRKQWIDERMWTVCKAYCALDYLPLVAQNIVDVVTANQGRVVKCVVTDLDNTLWGGIIGDDGLEGITLGAYGDGEPFVRLQHFLLELKRRGIVLAVCSKNDHAQAIEPFRSHPDMVLREDDIAVFMANWHPKPENIRAIREALNIGYDSIVFLDDNPVERDMVRQGLPEVIVPELPEDPADYVRALSELNLFEVASFSEEDARRADWYRGEVQRRSLQVEGADINEYLRSLEMTIRVARVDPFNLPRVVQLLQRSNQFNLTTRRHATAVCEEMMRDEARWVPLYVRLQDKFADNGVISVVILEMDGLEARVDTWVMSCRVLGRGVEHFTMNRVVELAAQRGAQAIVGDYIPTAKNAMVKDFFGRFGFTKVEEQPDGRALWRLAVPAYAPTDTCIREG